MADSFFGFDTSISNINDDEGGGGPSEDEYDALNDETFGQDSDAFDWEVEHEHLAEQLESSRGYRPGRDHLDHSQQDQLEASLSQLVLDEADGPQACALGSSVWRHDLPFPTTKPTPSLKNVCTVEEVERQLRQKQQYGNQQQSYGFQPRFPPVILQRPPGLQAPVPLPFSQSMAHNQSMGQMNQSLNNIIGSNNQMGQNVNQMGHNVNQIGQNVNQMGQNVGHNVNQMGQNVNQMGQNVNQFMQNANQMSFQNQMGQNSMMSLQNMQLHGQPNQMMQNQMGQTVNSMGQNLNQMGQNVNQMGQNVNQINQNSMGQNQMMQNGNQFQGMSQFPHMMGQPRMMTQPAPPGINLPRQNFTPNMGQFNLNFRGPTIQPKPEPQLNQHQIINQPLMPLKNQPQINQNSNPDVKHKNQKINPPLPTQNKVDTKMQKNRVYNSKVQQSQMPSLTSQNLVQMIQNTHPMLQHNSFHNANHHPILNNRSNMFNSNQFSGQNVNSNQRHNGTYSNYRYINGDDASSSSDSDEYAGLMTQREKQWLINIQMLQLNTGTPYIHDFYYTVFLERQAMKEKEGVKEAHKANQQNHPFYSGGVTLEPSQFERERHNSQRHNSTSEDAPRTYVPTQFENSLGKLQCGSVTAPRKIIDVEVVGGEGGAGRVSRPNSVASSNNPAEAPREIRRTKQLLLDIEALYLILLRIEELNDPLAISNALILKEREEKQKQLEQAQREADECEEDSNVFLRNIESVQRRPKQDSPKTEGVDKRQVVNLAVNQKPVPTKNLLDEDKEELVGKMFAGLLHGDRLAMMLTVRKGRLLVSRFLSRVPPPCPPHGLGRARALWARVLRALPAAARTARRDDGTLHALAAHYDRYISHTNGWSAILESCCLLSEAFDPARTPYALTTSLTLSCVTSLINRALLLVNTPEATSSERQYTKFLKTLARALKNTSLNVAKPVQCLPEKKLMHHLKQIESRATVQILQRGKTAAEFGDLTKNDVCEQLVKHLC